MTPFRAAPSVLITILLSTSLMVAFALDACAASVLLVVGSGLLILLWRTHAAVREHLGASAAEVRARIATLGSGDFGVDSPVPGARKETVMGWLEDAQGALVAIQQARRQTEERLQVSAARYRLLAENASDVIWTMSLDGRITDVSPSGERLRGFTPTEAMQQRLEEILTPESQAITLDYFSRLAFLLHAGLPLERARNELEYRCKDGSTIWCDVYVLPVYTADGIPVELLGMSRDITALKRAESAAKQSERHLRTMLEQLPVGIAVTRLQPDQQILYRNTKFDQTFGWTPEEIPTHDAWFVRAYPDEDYRREVFDQWSAAITRAAAQQGQVTPHEFRVTSRDGTVKDIVIGGTVLDDRLVCSFADISERKRFEGELVQARDAAETANRALQKTNAELQRLAVTDHLTGVWNRAYFENAVSAEIARAARYGTTRGCGLVWPGHSPGAVAGTDARLACRPAAEAAGAPNRKAFHGTAHRPPRRAADPLPASGVPPRPRPAAAAPALGTAAPAPPDQWRRARRPLSALRGGAGAARSGPQAAPVGPGERSGRRRPPALTSERARTDRRWTQGDQACRPIPGQPRRSRLSSGAEGTPCPARPARDLSFCRPRGFRLALRALPQARQHA